MRATGSVIPAQLLAGACTHEARVSLEAYDLPNTPELFSWANELANGVLRNFVLHALEFEAVVDWDTWQVQLIRTERSAMEILDVDCGYSNKDGIVRTRIGPWVGGMQPPPSISIGRKAQRFGSE
mmetsp:Transcript_8314/g.13952  ORF Transcript_8314/g.13952 Transcript_8314/m.13952 type:complete len:125 (-) Transcript_8314:10-384(-)